jgi:hypothetical protein
VIGQWKQLSLADQESLAYTNDVIHEMQKMGNIFCLDAPKEVTVDTTLAGYHLLQVTRQSQVQILKPDFEFVKSDRYSCLNESLKCEKVIYFPATILLFLHVFPWLLIL